MNDGGPAFPQSGTIGASGQMYVSDDHGGCGMSLRDWFAGTIALTNFDEKLIELYRTDARKTVVETIEYIAELRVRHADALIAVLTERDKASEKSP